MKDSLKVVLDGLVPDIVDIFGTSLIRIVLYGSVARGEDTPESDVDIAVITELCTSEMNDRLLDAVVKAGQEYDRLLSVMDINYGLYMQWRDYIPFYQNIDREGVALWEKR